MSDVFHETFFVKEDDKLVFENKGREAMFDKFVKCLEQGKKYRVFIEEINDSHTQGQLNKIHKCIRIIAQDTGNDFNTIKNEVKSRIGYDGESFANASYDELDFAIKETITLGDELGINLH